MSEPASDRIEGRDSEPYRSYAAGVEARIDDDGPIGRAFDAWSAFVDSTLGAPFAAADLDRERPRTAFFRDACYYDRAVRDALERLAERLGFEPAAWESPGGTAAARSGPGPGGGPIDLDAVHGAVGGGDEDDGGGAGRPALPEDAGPVDVRRLYEDVVPGDLRGALGDHHTPRGVADLAVDALTVTDAAAERFLDPGCGTGIFLAASVDRVREAAGRAPDERVAAATGAVRGIDLNPFAIRGARLSYALALAPALAAADDPTVAFPVVHGDALGIADPVDPGTDEGNGGETDGETRTSLPRGAPDWTVDHLVGNPPWITWSDLPERRRAGWRERHVDRLDLFPHRGAAARLGHGNDDLAASFVGVCVDRYLAEGGDAAVVLKRDQLRGPAGRLLRRGRIGDRSLSVRRVHDLGALSPFEGVATDAAVYALAADREQSFPVATTVWTDGDGSSGDDDRSGDDAGDGADDRRDPVGVSFADGEGLRATAGRRTGGLVPVDPDDPASAWVRAGMERAALGGPTPEIRHGLKDDASDVFGLDREELGAVDEDLVYPYLASRHVVKFGLFGHDLRLVPSRRAGEDNEAWLRETYPDTYDYLERRREALEDRESGWLDDGPFYSAFGLGEYTWAPYKVVWCRLGFKPHFAVAGTVTDPDLGERPVVPGDHCMFVPRERREAAHYLCALLNAAPYQRALRELGSGKASLSKTAVSRLRLPSYDEVDRGTAERLAALSERAHAVVAEHTDVTKREYNRRTIDELAAIRVAVDRTVEGLLPDYRG